MIREIFDFLSGLCELVDDIRFARRVTVKSATYLFPRSQVALENALVGEALLPRLEIEATKLRGQGRSQVQLGNEDR
jgi:hypothetical protein